MPEPTEGDPRRVAVLISGVGSNLKALVAKADGYQVMLVATNKPQAPGIDWARANGIPSWAWDSRGIERDRFDGALSRAIEDHRIGSIALAGYMRLLSPGFIRRWRGRILNIHPSLLPKYRGLDTHARVIAAGERVSGCSVHVVTEELDAGDVLGRTEVPVEPGETAATLKQRVRAAEHQLYPRVLAEFVRGRPKAL